MTTTTSPAPAVTVTVVAVRFGDQLTPAERAACRETARDDRAAWGDLYDTEPDTDD